MPRGLVIQFKEQQGLSRIPVLWKLTSQSSVFEIVTMSYFWKFLWLGRKSFDWFYFLKSKKNTSEWICLSFRSLENRICSMTILFFLSTRTKLCKGDRSLFFWSLSIETSFGVYVCTVDCLRPPTEKYSGNILSLMCS